MDVRAGQHRSFPAVAMVIVVFLLSVLGQFYIARQFPAVSGLAQLKPDLVFLDIPLHLPVAIDLILAPALFLLVYPVVVMLWGWPSFGQVMQRVRAAFTGLFVILFCMLSGAFIYFMVQDHLSTQVRNGINSLGIIADIQIAYPGQETIYLRGSLVLLVCFLIGLLICIRKIRKEPRAGLTREQRMTPYERMLQEKRLVKKQPMKEAEVLFSGFCYNQPVARLMPEALYYMPK